MISISICTILKLSRSGHTGNHIVWPCKGSKKMTSSCDSPVTPTLPLHPAVMQRTSSKSKGIILTSKVVAEDSDSFWKPCLNADEKASCKEALKHLKMKKSTPVLIDKEFASLMAMRIPKHELLGRFKAAQRSGNEQKNRYMDVLPFDDTRVVLQSKGSDYINASFIEGAPGSSLPRFIATQGPLRRTLADFWEMVMQQRCSIIVMLTSLIDGNMEKCAPYFPTEVNQCQTFGSLQVTNRTLTYSRYSIAKRVLEVQSIEQPHEPSLHVLHLEYLDWPDHGVPPSTRPIRELFRCLSSIPTDAGPFVVHCSAGIGRSGTYIAIDYSLRRILTGDTAAVDLEDIVRHLRQQRVGMVQTKAQYHFCYAAIIDELEEILKR